MKRFFGLAFMVALTSSLALAQDSPPNRGQGSGQGRGRGMALPSFAELDKNKDKKISRDEWPSQLPPQMFDRLDANHDGFIDEQELEAARNRFAGGPGGGAFGRTGENLLKLLDANGDGKVSREEFAKLLSLFDILDKDHNGELSTEELNGLTRAINETQTLAGGSVELNNLFDRYDKNKDGKITADELGNDRMFKMLDLNKDGVVTREEADVALKQMKKAADARKNAQPNN